MPKAGAFRNFIGFWKILALWKNVEAFGTGDRRRWIEEDKK
jgi:hypothetical protein